jgi:hypothetical protein
MIAMLPSHRYIASLIIIQNWPKVTWHLIFNSRKALYTILLYLLPCQPFRDGNFCLWGWPHWQHTQLSMSLHSAEFKVYIALLLHGLLEDDPDRRFQFCGALWDAIRTLCVVRWGLFWTIWWCHITLTEHANRLEVSTWGAMSSFGVPGPYFEWT